ncbi:Rieske (2Fe-2S) protein [Chryseobacterium sp. Y16C]|uniref:QcrA and Rieske domain-containing protein n=1 Tax=Chryseobacterium sp. Y16C TaxID=2920939 RepID=UPI001F0AFC14|nr:Rieske (2Fe-2S) protein [Chryseobacterium sp. Y16C]UMQ43291.1 Rieske (2Fe-2S) protein [Chryseobacterium sp. Y16C]
MSENHKKIPTWKADFPIKKREAAYVSRKEFIKLITFFSGTLAFANVAVPLFNFFRKEKEIKPYFIGLTTDLQVGGMRTFYINEDHRNPYMLIRLAEDTWKVFEQKCTHLSCSVLYNHNEQLIECPCHHGFFNPDDGSVIQGPPPRPLPQLKVVIKEDKIYVTDFEKETEESHG